MAAYGYIEVRCPTYNRPALLKRAVDSLFAQTYPYWRCIIFDDSTDGVTEELCATWADPRIIYRRNGENLGAARNIDKCFRREALVEGEYFTILEDDNYFLPTYFSESLRVLRDRRVSVLYTNQHIEKSLDEGRSFIVDGSTTLDQFYCSGEYRPEEMWCSLFFTIGISNSGLFWSAQAKSNFEIGSRIKDPVLHEKMRTARLLDNIEVVLSPLIVWRDNRYDSVRAKTERRSQYLAFLRNAGMERTLYASVYKVLRRRGLLSLLASPRFPVPLAKREEGVRRCGLSWPGPSNLTWRRRLDLAVKRTILGLVIKDRGVDDLRVVGDSTAG